MLFLFVFMLALFYQKPGFLLDELYSHSVWLKDTAMLFPYEYNVLYQLIVAVKKWSGREKSGCHLMGVSLIRG